MDEIVLKSDNHCSLHKQTCGSQILWFWGEKKISQYISIFPYNWSRSVLPLLASMQNIKSENKLLETDGSFSAKKKTKNFQYHSRAGDNN